MRIQGTVVPVGTQGFTREGWCQIVASRPELRRARSREVRSFGQTFRGPADTTEVLMDGQPIGVVYWSMGENSLVNVSIESRGLPLVLELAVALGGVFQLDSGVFLHFGYFDHPALADGRLVGRSDVRMAEFMAIRQDLFRPLPCPDTDASGITNLADPGFFDRNGVLTCWCFSSVRLPVDRILALVDQSGCDVVYDHCSEYGLLPRTELPIILDPERIPLEKLGRA